MRNKWMIWLMILLLLFAFPALAEGGNGTGGGKGETVSVDKTSVEEGGTAAPDEEIILTFTNNVVNAKVRDKNAGLISLVNEAGDLVEIDVILADDQVEPDLKREIKVVPKTPLEAGKYALTAHAGITAKNGSEMAEDFVLTFTVASDAPAEVPTEDPGQPEEEPAREPAAQPAAEPAAEQKEAETTTEPAPEPVQMTAESAARPEKTGNPALWIVLGAVVIATVIAAAVILRKKKA